MEEKNKFVDNTDEGKQTFIEPGDKLVISGISGTFPSSNNVHEFRDNLFNKVNMIQPNRRWDLKHPEIPPCSGTIPEIEYDPGFFGVHDRQSQSMDAMLAVLMEKTVEAIFDAGLHPSDLENTRTGVYVGICYSENDKFWFFENLGPQTFVMTGSERSIVAHRLSYFFKLKGPSLIMDTACSSSLYAIEHAFRAMQSGEIDNAIVAGANLCLHPFMNLEFYRLGVLSNDGRCKSFDEAADGYGRSEAIAVLILQKAKNAKRAYAELVHAKTNCDGYKEEGITFPSKSAQIDLLNGFYDECNMDRYSLSFLEAHGTGTAVGDPEECSAIDDIFTKGRKKPLLVGSVKSNIGHTEPASGVCSIIKCIIATETGLIPPNINFKKPKPSIKGIVEDRMRVVTEKSPFEDNRGLIGINSFGFGGGNSHVLLRWNPKTKQNRSVVKDNLPRLVCVSGRTERAVTSLLDSVANNKFDPEYVKLLHDGFRKNVENHMHRGYVIVSPLGEIARSTNFLKYFPNDSSPVCFVFGEMKNWDKIGSDLMAITAFSTFIQNVQTVLNKHGVNISDVLLKKIPNKDIGLLLGSVVVQMGLIELLNLVEIKPLSKFGHSVGKLLSAYYDGLLMPEEAINYALSLDKAFSNLLESNNNYQENKIVNGNTIINGNTTQNEDDEILPEYLRTSLRSKDLDSQKDNLLQSLLKDDEHVKSNKDIRRIKQFANALINEKSSEVLSENSILLNMGDSPLIESGNKSVVSLFHEKANDYMAEFLQGLGSLYELGYNPQISKLYPPVPLPVSRGTEMISPHIKWNHRRPKFFPRYVVEVDKQAMYGAKTFTIHEDDPEWTYITGHFINGRNVFPAVGYLYLVWKTFSAMKSMTMENMQICFENCKFVRATTIPKKSNLLLQVNIQKITGNFEVTEGDSQIATGSISLLKPREKFVITPQDYKTSAERNPGLKLNSKDVYKELRLRGYSYKGPFIAIEECSTSSTKACIRWYGNWVAFIDSIIQLKVLDADTRLLYIPTTISKLIIDADAHMEIITSKKLQENDNPLLDVTIDCLSDTRRSGGISISGVIATSIPRRRVPGIPVLESYTFVPNVAEINVSQSVRVNMQIILENSLTLEVKSVEVIDEFTDKDAIPLSPIVKSVLEDQPLIQSSLKIFSAAPLDVDVEVENKTLKTESDCLVVIVSKVLSRPDILKEALSALPDDGFIITRESRQFDASQYLSSDLSVLTVHQTSNETLLLLRKQSKITNSEYIKIGSTQHFDWLPKVQSAIYKGKNSDVILFTENDPKNGIMGLVNCLRRELPSKKVRCVFAMDTTKKFLPQEPFYSKMLEKQMAVNVYKDGQWGTYRHLRLEEENRVEREHCFLQAAVRGDLSSLKWEEGPLRHDMKLEPEKELIYVYYSALNFKNIMLASGKLNEDAMAKHRLEQEAGPGCEFSGRDAKGRRYMGMTNYGAPCTLIAADNYKFPIPDEWSLEEAATVPVVYGTVIYGLVMRGQIKRGESILIHSGTGGIGQAAIRLALYYGCRVFTTVGTQEKRDFLKTIFPQLREDDIGNSHNQSFEQMIFSRTNGRGVDMVLNSLAEEKLLTSVRCLARGGRLIEIGKFDMVNNHDLNLLLLQKEASYVGVMLDQLLSNTPEVKNVLVKTMTDFIKLGVVKPLNRTVFKYEEGEQAFRFIASGKHKGKVLIQIREPEKELLLAPSIVKFPCVARYYCDPDKVYVIIGGLGGFGLELADWLILRGARKMVLVSRKGITTGYQSYRLSIWESYGANVKISTAPVTTREGCKQLIEEALEMGTLVGIFNLAVVLADAIFENQNLESFETSFGPKAYATEYLDELSRKMCPDLSEFVVFSSVSCGRGNAGQTNYGMSNSVMERICENRKKEGYPALAIQWGAVGDVGLVADMLEHNTIMEIGGTLQQRIFDCLHVLDTLLTQREASIVSSMVVAEKRAKNASNNALDAIVSMLGISDSKSVSFHSTLSELGMDSIMAVEVKQALERDFEVFLSLKEIRNLTLAQFRDIQNKSVDESTLQDKDVANFGIENLLRLVGDEKTNTLPLLEMASKVPQNSKAPTLLLFGGMEGFASVFHDLTGHLNAHTIGVQLNLENTAETIPEMAQSVMHIVEKYFPDREFNILGYSFGILVVLEVVHILESRGYSGTVICIDGGLLLTKRITLGFNQGSQREFETAMLCHLLSFYMSSKQVATHKESIFKCKTWDESLNLTLELFRQTTGMKGTYEKLLVDSIYRRIRSTLNYTPTYSKLKTKMKLLKPTELLAGDLPEDYGLSEYFEKPIEIHTFEGNHITILENEAVAEIVNTSF